MTATAQAYRPLFSPGIALGRSRALGHIETVSSSKPTQASILGRRLIMPYSARASSTGIVGFSLLLMLAPALAALPISLPIDSASLSDLMAGRDVCGDADIPEDEDGAVSEDEVGELVATAGPRTARRLRRNGVVVAPGAEAGGAQQPVGRLDYSASVLSSCL